ncbi:hypothetical protein STEG23_027879 [Scotinomys teguina]
MLLLGSASLEMPVSTCMVTCEICKLRVLHPFNPKQRKAHEKMCVSIFEHEIEKAFAFQCWIGLCIVPGDEGSHRSFTSGNPLSSNNDCPDKVEIGQRQCKRTYNNIKNKTSPESSPPPTSRPEYCNIEKADENDLKNNLMKMLEEALEGKMKNDSKEI